MRSFKIFRPREPKFMEEFGEWDIRAPEGLMEYLVGEFSNPGDFVFDPFAGLGTTLFVAEHLGRIPYGIAFNEKKFQYIQKHLKNPSNIRMGDTRVLDPKEWPPMDFCYTSPPYMRVIDGEDPFSDYIAPGTYQEYLDEMERIFIRIKQVMRPEAFVAVEFANMIHDGEVTTLAWDAGNIIRRVLHMRGEIIIAWERTSSFPEDQGTNGYGMDHSYCLVFQK